jgi:hypothetical protein
LCFNFIAKKMGGIDERYFSFRNDEDHTERSSQKNEAGIHEGIHQADSAVVGEL